MAPSSLARVAIGLLPGLGLATALATGGCDRQTPRREQANAAAPALTAPDEVAPDEVAPRDSTADASTATVGKVDRAHRGEAAPGVTFRDPAGKPVTLAAFRGKPMLVNLWATWCAPCVKEMPSLDTAAAALDGKVVVLAVSQDMQPDKVVPFFATRKLARLKPYTDPEMGLSLHYRVNLPTTLLIAANGQEVWRISGAFDWSGAEAQALLAEAR